MQPLTHTHTHTHTHKHTLTHTHRLRTDIYRWSPCREFLPHSRILWFQLCQTILWLTSGLLPERTVHYRLVSLLGDGGVRLQSLSPSHCCLCSEHIWWYQGSCLLLTSVLSAFLLTFLYYNSSCITITYLPWELAMMFNNWLGKGRHYGYRECVLDEHGDGLDTSVAK